MITAIITTTPNMITILIKTKAREASIPITTTSIPITTTSIPITTTRTMITTIVKAISKNNKPV